MNPFEQLNSIVDGCEVKNLNYDDCKDEPWDYEPEYVTQFKNGETWFRIDIVCIAISMISLSFISFAIFSDRRINGHPNNIIALICLCDAF